MSSTKEHQTPLTHLTDEEELLRLNIRKFAQSDLAPLVKSMDEKAEIPSSLIRQLFQLGIMGIEIPERLGGAEGHFFLSILSVEELSKVDPSIGVLVDVQNTLVINAFLRLSLIHI